MIAINEVVPVGNDVVDGASCVAKGNAAIHATRGLRADFVFGELVIDFEVVVDALFDGPANRQFSREFFKPGDLAHEP
jgi:hypothetical protein